MSCFDPRYRRRPVIRRLAIALIVLLHLAPARASVRMEGFGSFLLPGDSNPVWCRCGSRGGRPRHYARGAVATAGKHRASRADVRAAWGSPECVFALRYRYRIFLDGLDGALGGTSLSPAGKALRRLYRSLETETDRLRATRRLAGNRVQIHPAWGFLMPVISIPLFR